MNKYSILKVISQREPALLQSVYEEAKKEDRDAGSLVEELDSLASEGLIEEHKEEAGVTYVLTESGKKKLNTLGK
ncbi:MAG TPA: hypothetical protein VHT73_03110 [Thermodesulfobacteriota bacterium]|nr:hypothetical protein [Thermodesulfobacteriota bacterium]